MKSAYRKGNKVYWHGSYASGQALHYWPSQWVRAESTDGRAGMVLIKCYVHFRPESGREQPKLRYRWVNESESS